MLVIGDTGATGREEVDQALAAGVAVEVMVRNPADAASFPASVTVHIADVADLVSLANAVAGQSTVISCLGVRPGQTTGTVRSDGNAAIVAAMGTDPSKRLISVSAVGVGSSLKYMSKPLRFMLPLMVGAKRMVEIDKGEQPILASQLNWTIVRPPRLVKGPPTEKWSYSDSLPLVFRSQITRADLAAALLKIITDETTFRTAVSIANV